MGTDPLMNLHTHTLYSDGSFLPEQVVNRAYSGGLKYIAITDHFETDKVGNPLTRYNFERYFNNIRALGTMYEGRMKVLAGVEIDTNPMRCDLEHLPYDLLNRLDLVLFEYVNDPQNGGISLDQLARYRDRLNVPCGLCHWDVDRIFNGTTPVDLADRLNKMDLFVEVSTSDYYTRDQKHYYELGERFFEAFRGKVKLSIGTDTHRRIDEVVNISKGQDFVRRMSLQGQMLF